MIDLKTFCLADEIYPYLKEPFSRGEFTYATNDHIIVRVARRPDVEERDECDKLNVAGALNRAGPKPDFVLLNIKLPAPLRGQCLFCDGHGTEHDCPRCECKCEECDGTGEAKEKASITIRSAIFYVKYIRLIQALPNPQLAAKPSKDGPSWFAFDGGDGILMPMSRPHEHHFDEQDLAEKIDDR